MADSCLGPTTLFVTSTNARSQLKAICEHQSNLLLDHKEEDLVRHSTLGADSWRCDASPGKRLFGSPLQFACIALPSVYGVGCPGSSLTSLGTHHGRT